MSGKTDETAGFVRGASQKSGSKASGEMVDGLKSKTLIENPGEKGVLSDGVRVSEEAKVLVGDSKSGTVIWGTEFKPVEFGNLGYTDTNDANKRRVVATASRNNIKWESRVMNMVGRVLDGKLHLNKEVEDVDDSKSWSEVNVVADKDAWQNSIGEPSSENKKVNLVTDKDTWQNEIGGPTSENKIDFNGTDNNNGSVMLGLSSPAEGSGLNGNQDLITYETVPNVELKSKKKLKTKHEFLIPKAREENDITEKEGYYYVSDLVWGKVSCHPWWPGQIFSPQSSTGEAAMHLKNGAYLIAYFGDGTYAWNRCLKIKPFRMHFSKMSEQSNSENFCHAVQCALDEASRRVEFGLSCPCLPPEVRDEIKFQVIENTGIMEKSSRLAGGDVLFGAVTFSPGELLQSLESFARRPYSKPDRLQFTIEKAQVLAYNRWKGFYQLPVYEVRRAFLEHDTLLNAKEEVEGLFPTSTAIDAIEGARNVTSSCENHAMFNPIASNSEGKRGRRGRKPKNLLAVSPNGKLQREEKVPVDIPTPNLVLTKLSLLAKKPMQGLDAMNPVVGLLRKFRKSVCPNSLSQVDDETNSGKFNIELPVFEIGNGGSSKKRESAALDGSSGKRKKIKEKSMSILMSSGSSSSVPTDKKSVRRGPTNVISSGENPEMVDTVAGVDKQPSNFQTSDSFGIGGINDSYWTDRIIRTDSQEAEADVTTVSNLADNRKEPISMDLDQGNPSDLVDEASKEYCPTALVLHFSNLEAIPAVPILNEIFTAYGPLIESETKILTKSKRAKVVFKRKEHAETAFSSTGKYRTFGPALTSYRLNFVLNLDKEKKKKTDP